MDFRFTLSHERERTLMTQHPFSGWVNEGVATTEPWTTGEAPTVTIPNGGTSDRLRVTTLTGLSAGTHVLRYSITSTKKDFLSATIRFEKAGAEVSQMLPDTYGADPITIPLIIGTTIGEVNITLSDVPDEVNIMIADAGSTGSTTVTLNSLDIDLPPEIVSQEISEPDGWEGAKIILERHPEFFSLIEYYEGAANGGFVFYGSNGTEDGGIDFIRDVETNYGFDANIEITVEYSADGVEYLPILEGYLDLSAKQEMKDNRMQVPVVRNGLWAKFINRYGTAVDLSSTTTLDGNPCEPVTPITVNLPSQIIRKEFDGYLLESRNFTQDELATTDYIQFDVDTYNLDEIEKKYDLVFIDNPEIPQSLIDIEEDGEYTFDLRIEVSIIHYSEVGCELEQTVTGSESYLDVYIQKNNEAAIAFTATSSPLIYENISTIYTYAGVMTLKKGDQIKIYGDVTGNISDLGEYANLWIHSKNGRGTVTIPNIVLIEPSGCLVDGTTTGSINGLPAPSLEEIPTYFNIVGLTTYVDTEGQGYLIHDLIYGVLKRILH